MLLGANNVFAQPGGLSNKVVKFDKAKFINSVKSSFDGKVKGYQVVLLNGGSVAAEYADGDARNKADGQADMTFNTPANIGSTAKFFAGIALLKLFTTPQGNPNGVSLDKQLDSKIYYYLPNVWKNDIHPSWKDVTFRELLQHKSGVRSFTKAEVDALTAKGLKKNAYQYLLKELKPANRGVRKYENFNFTVLTYLIPMFADQLMLQNINKEIYEKKVSPNDVYIQTRLGDAYEKYLRGELFTKITPNINPSCDAPNEYPKQNKIFAPAYKSVSDLTKGFAYSERVTNGACHAQGGWYISARELAAFVANFTASETLIPNAVETKMFDDDNANEMLVWSFTTSNKWATDNFGMDAIPYMGGDHDPAHATIVKLPNGYHAVGIVNSDEMGSGTITNNIVSAFQTSVSF